MGLVVPAVLPASRAELEKKLKVLTRIPSIHRIQIDAVDGRFATPASWPYTAEGELGRAAEQGEMLPELGRLEYEIDLMCLDALTSAGAWLALGASRLTFHAESAPDLPRLLTSARKRYGSDLVPGPVSFGLALNLSSDIALIEPCLGLVSYIQCMGVARIGRQGQPFDERVYEKVRVLRERYPEIPLQVDGGVSLTNAKKLVALGVSALVVGSAIVGVENPVAALGAFEALAVP